VGVAGIIKLATPIQNIEKTILSNCALSRVDFFRFPLLVFNFELELGFLKNEPFLVVFLLFL